MLRLDARRAAALLNLFAVLIQFIEKIVVSGQQASIRTLILTVTRPSGLPV
jgi:hypothetical protein